MHEPPQILENVSEIVDFVKDEWPFFIAGIRGELYKWAEKLDKEDKQDRKFKACKKLHEFAQELNSVTSELLPETIHQGGLSQPSVLRLLLDSVSGVVIEPRFDKKLSELDINHFTAFLAKNGTIAECLAYGLPPLRPVIRRWFAEQALVDNVDDNMFDKTLSFLEKKEVKNLLVSLLVKDKKNWSLRNNRNFTFKELTDLNIFKSRLQEKLSDYRSIDVRLDDLVEGSLGITADPLSCFIDSLNGIRLFARRNPDIQCEIQSKTSELSGIKMSELVIAVFLNENPHIAKFIYDNMAFLQKIVEKKPEQNNMMFIEKIGSTATVSKRPRDDGMLNTSTFELPPKKTHADNENDNQTPASDAIKTVMNA